VLAGVDLHIHRGERLALLGRSGSGKSTLLNLIAGIDLPDGGEISMEGRNLTRLSENERTLFRRKHIGFIYQFFNLIPTLSVAENIALPLQLNRVSEETIRQKTLEMLQAVDLDDRGNDYPDQLSGGEQQRVAIARGLVHRPSLVLADEPTGNLDARSGRRVLDLLTGLAGNYRQTLLIVTHSLEVAKSADRVIVLEAGKVDAAGGDFSW
jgi:putative ABC transport system ATP-binding protein